MRRQQQQRGLVEPPRPAKSMNDLKPLQEARLLEKAAKLTNFGSSLAQVRPSAFVSRSGYAGSKTNFEHSFLSSGTFFSRNVLNIVNTRVTIVRSLH